jgi:membrane protein implicated in regulation of membrane protease activity
MRHLWWLIPFVAALAAFRVWWAGPADVGVLLILVCGLAGLAYLVMRPRRSMPPLPDEQGQDRRHVERDIPPPPG